MGRNTRDSAASVYRVVYEVYMLFQRSYFHRLCPQMSPLLPFCYFSWALFNVVGQRTYNRLKDLLSHNSFIRRRNLTAVSDSIFISLRRSFYFSLSLSLPLWLPRSVRRSILSILLKTKEKEGDTHPDWRYRCGSVIYMATAVPATESDVDINFYLRFISSLCSLVCRPSTLFTLFSLYSIMSEVFNFFPFQFSGDFAKFISLVSVLTCVFVAGHLYVWMRLKKKKEIFFVFLFTI